MGERESLQEREKEGERINDKTEVRKESQRYL